MHLGQCYCNNIQFSLHLLRPLSEYQPRRCDCDFCQQHDIHYLSDNTGYLEIAQSTLTNFATQGDNLARFIQCGNCANIVAAYYCFDQKSCDYRCAINSRLLIDKSLLPASIDISPKLLSGQEKLERWRKLWTPIRF